MSLSEYKGSGNPGLHRFFVTVVFVLQLNERQDERVACFLAFLNFISALFIFLKKWLWPQLF